MRKRNHKCQVWLNDEEKELVEKAKVRTGYSGEGYIRSLIRGYQPKELPPIKYYDVLQELYIIGGILKELTDKAKGNSGIEIDIFQEAEEKLFTETLKIQQAFMLPSNIEEK